jgi:8-oxo-dGTP diphosphatase
MMSRDGRFNPNIPSCYTIIENERGEWLFVLRKHTGYMDGQYGLPGGRVEPGEPADLGAANEVAEEVGLGLRLADLQLVHVQHRSKAGDPDEFGQILDPRIDFYFKPTRWSGQPVNAEPHRHSEIAWLDPDDLPKNVMVFIADAIMQIRKGKTFSRHGRW